MEENTVSANYCRLNLKAIQDAEAAASRKTPRFAGLPTWSDTLEAEEAKTLQLRELQRQQREAFLSKRTARLKK
jgi:hypothetical protein